MRILGTALLIILGFVGYGQTPKPSGFPTQLSTGWHKFGYPQADSGLIAAKRDTSGWLPRFSGTIVMRPQDRNLYWYDSTLLRWNRIARFGDTAGTAVIWGNISGDLTNQTDVYDSLLDRVKYTDTADMLLPYLRKIDTTNKWVTSIFKKDDSVFYVRGGIPIFSFKDSSGSSTGGTVTEINSGYGLDGGPITTIGTLLVDSAELAAYFLRRKDSTLYVTDTRLSDTAAAKVDISGHAATSILGRAANSTGDVADIQATIAGTFAKRTTTTIVFDSVDYADIKGVPDLQQPGVYFSPNAVYASGFIVLATAIVRVTNSFSHGLPVTWGILEDSQHKGSFFDSAYGNGSNQRLVVRFPQVKNVMNVSITPDEIFALNNVVVGPSVGTTNFEAQVSRSFPLGMRLSGNGTNTWVANSAFGAGSYFTISTYNTANGQTGIIYSPFYGKDNNRPIVQYIGNNGYSVRRIYSGTGSNDIVFILTDAFGNPVTASPQTTDVVMLSNFGMQGNTVQMGTWSLGNNDFMTTLSNFWVFGLFECWIVAAPVSNTTIRVRWQTDYPSATTYKIYRSATGLHGTYTLIHTGTEGSYTDAGLTPGTLYTYKMVAVVGGVDTDVSTFNASTKF